MWLARCLPACRDRVSGARSNLWLAIFPATAFLAAGAAFESVYQTIHSQGSTAGSSVPLYPFDKFSNLMGFDWVARFDQAHARED